MARWKRERVYSMAGFCFKVIPINVFGRKEIKGKKSDG
ncbi:hypothetical protein V6Z11_D10G273800 [Gossypium hirsutum]